MMIDALPDTVDTVDTVDMGVGNRVSATRVVPVRIEFDQSRDRALGSGVAHRVHPVHPVHPALPAMDCDRANGPTPEHTVGHHFEYNGRQFIMSTEAIDAARNEPARFTSVWCRVESCNRPVDGNVGGPYCWTHRRTLRFSAALNDALTEFLGTAGGSMRPSKFNANDMREAGELFGLGLSKLFGAAFGTTVAVNREPITPTTVNGHKGWHVAFRWQENEGESNGFGALDEDDDPNDDEDDYDDGDDDE
jgi:hypothetical protein